MITKLMLAIVLLIAVMTLCIAPACAGAQTDHSSDVNYQIDLLLKGLQTDSLKDAVRHHAQQLHEGDAEAIREAVLFFHDLKAKNVLKAILLTYTTTDQLLDKKKPLRYTIECLDIFTVEDIPTLYQATENILHIKMLTQGSDEGTARYGFPVLLAGRAVHLLQLKPEQSVRLGMTSEQVYANWVYLLEQAKKQEGSLYNIDSLRKQIDAIHQQYTK